ncbi:basic proline-rich protein-like, partial [Marmota monax]|uniref:basic proline-rich protein-like n=1 Tax=Marmota monax TaxID=9995 RepID=UPI0026F35102
TPAPAGWKSEPRGRNPAGRGRPARSPPPAATRRRGACTKARLPLPEWPVRESSCLQAPGPGVQGPRLGLGPGRRGPQRRGRGQRTGRSCKQPQRPGLASKSPASQAPPRAAQDPGPPRGRASRGSGHRRGVRVPPQKARAARGAAPAAEKGEVRTYLSLLSTPSWIHLSTSPQSIMEVGTPPLGMWLWAPRDPPR